MADYQYRPTNRERSQKTSKSLMRVHSRGLMTAVREVDKLSRESRRRIISAKHRAGMGV